MLLVGWISRSFVRCFTLFIYTYMSFCTPSALIIFSSSQMLCATMRNVNMCFRVCVSENEKMRDKKIESKIMKKEEEEEKKDSFSLVSVCISKKVSSFITYPFYFSSHPHSRTRFVRAFSYFAFALLVSRRWRSWWWWSCVVGSSCGGRKSKSERKMRKKNDKIGGGGGLKFILYKSWVESFFFWKKYFLI